MVASLVRNSQSGVVDSDSQARQAVKVPSFSEYCRSPSRRISMPLKLMPGSIVPRPLLMIPWFVR